MQLFAEIADLRRWRATAPRPVGLVPTMGALHDGHLALVAEARRRCATVLASIFVNPMQFGPNEDLANYPRDLPGDLERLRAAGVAVVFAPTTEVFVPDDLATTVSVAGVTAPLEGVWRPGHFDGVATVVTKLFNIVQPDVAVFGQKDIQQATLVRRMVEDLDWPLRIDVVPTVRERDGLALSSRNVYLSEAARREALVLSRGLFAALTSGVLAAVPFALGREDAAAKRKKKGKKKQKPSPPPPPPCATSSAEWCGSTRRPASCPSCRRTRRRNRRCCSCCPPA